jgi:hypothetical protein
MRKTALFITCILAFAINQQAQEGKTRRAENDLNSSAGFSINETNPGSLPDLTITECGLVSIAADANQKFLYIQVSIKVKNIGPTKAGPSTLVAYYRNPGGGMPVREAEDSIPIATLRPGQFFSKVHSFRAPVEYLKPGLRFEFWIKTDAKNEVEESNEANNNSPKMILNTPNW